MVFKKYKFDIISIGDCTLDVFLQLKKGKIVCKKEKDNCIGFELLGDQSFSISTLNWQNNLIAKDLLPTRRSLFSHNR